MTRICIGIVRWTLLENTYTSSVGIKIIGLSNFFGNNNYDKRRQIRIYIEEKCILYDEDWFFR